MTPSTPTPSTPALSAASAASTPALSASTSPASTSPAATSPAATSPATTSPAATSPAAASSASTSPAAASPTLTPSALYQKVLAWFNFSPAKSGDKAALREQCKQTLLTQLDQLKASSKLLPEAPLTNLELEAEQLTALNDAIAALEAVNPYPAPLRKGIELLEGPWQLRYSDAREITTLVERARWGLQLGAVYQTIAVESLSFENRADVHHRWSCIGGSVAVSARFEPATTPWAVRNRRINVYFQERSLSIRKLIGVKTPFLDRVRVVPVTPPEDRIPCLDITYLDGDFRIGRGGEGSLFVLTKVSD